LIIRSTTAALFFLSVALGSGSVYGADASSSKASENKNSSQNEVNYDDPNLAHSNGFVTEATSSCLKHTSNPENFERCIAAYSRVDSSVKGLKAPEPESEASAPSAASESKDAAKSGKKAVK
jgi:hypothetical protein